MCGPPIMMDVVHVALSELDVPLEHIHTERFDLIEGAPARHIDAYRVTYVIATLIVLGATVFAWLRSQDIPPA